MDFDPSDDPFSGVSSSTGYQPPVFESAFPQSDPFDQPQAVSAEDLEEQARSQQRDLENRARQQKLMAKDDKESLQRDARRKQAREDLKKWHEDRNKLILRTQELNLTKERELINSKASFSDSTSWKKVSSMIDYKENSDKKDQARMKSVLLAKKHESK